MDKTEYLEKRRYADISDLMLYTSLGRNGALKLGEVSGAKIKFGRRTIYDLEKIDNYLNQQEA